MNIIDWFIFSDIRIDKSAELDHFIYEFIKGLIEQGLEIEDVKVG